MNEQTILEHLATFGLTHEEAQLYVHLYKSGAQTPLKISRETNLNRTKIYRLIGTLKEKKLLEETSSARGKRLKASSAVNLEMLAFEEENQLLAKKELLPKLMLNLSQLSSTHETTFEVLHYHGIEGLKQMLWNELKAKEVLVFGCDTINTFVGKKFGDTHRAEVKTRKIHYYELGNQPMFKDPTLVSYNSVPGWEKFYKCRQVPETILKIRQDIQIYNQTVSVMNWQHGEKVGIEIINKPFTDMHRQIFWKFWEIAESVSKLVK